MQFVGRLSVLLCAGVMPRPWDVRTMSAMTYRPYISTIRRPYDVCYDPLTQSVQLLTSKESLTSISDTVRYQLSTLHDALSRIDQLSIPSP